MISLRTLSEDFDQTVWMRRLIWVFAGRTCSKVRYIFSRSYPVACYLYSCRWGNLSTEKSIDIFSYISKRNKKNNNKTYVVVLIRSASGFAEALLMSAHNLYFVEKSENHYLNTSSYREPCSYLINFYLLLTVTTLLSNLADKFIIFSYFSQKTGIDILYKLSPLETICMKCQILFSGKK